MDDDEEMSVDELKRDRAGAKRAFTRLANDVTRSSEDMTEEELKDSFKNLTIGAKKLMEINDDLEAGLVAALKKGSPGLPEQVKADLAKTAEETDTKLKEAKRLIKEKLWTDHAENAIHTALQAAESECEKADALRPDGSKEGYDFTLQHVTGLVKTATQVLGQWRQWIPSEELVPLQNRFKRLELLVPPLVAKMANFIQVRVKEDEERTPPPSPLIKTVPVIKLKPTALPKFTGVNRDFYRWKKDWEALQMQGEPTGSSEVKKVQLIDSLDDKVVRDLRLSTYGAAEDIFRVLGNRYGNKTAIALEIVDELQRMPAVKGHQPRKIVELIQTVEKSLQDLTDLGDTGAIKNPLTIRAIEGKLPDSLKKEWLVHVADRANAVAPGNRFDRLLAFLKTQESIYEQLEHLKDDEPNHPNRRDARSEPRQARTRSAQSDVGREPKKTRTRSTKSEVEFEPKQTGTRSARADIDPVGCIVCGEKGHKKKLYFCWEFRALKVAERKAAAGRLGACTRCLEVHVRGAYCKDDFVCTNHACVDGQTSEHHFYLCPNADNKRSSNTHRSSGGEGARSPPGAKSQKQVEQDELLKALGQIKEVPADLVRGFRQAFSHVASKSFSTVNRQQSLQEKYVNDLCKLQELPVLMMLLEVTASHSPNQANAGQKIGTLIDLASDTNYITHKAAARLELWGEEITLIVHGVSGMTTQVDTKRYILRIQVSTEGTLESHQLICYGLDSIADVHKSVTPQKLQKFFPDVPLHELTRPRGIDLLISHREGRLAPQRIKVTADLVLWDGPLGKTVGGAHPELFEEELTVTAYKSKTHFARSMRTVAMKYEEVTRSIPEPSTKSPISLQETSTVPVQESRTSTANRDFVDWWKWDSIGAACDPKCGGCRCGNCQPGGKDMTLAEERELEVVRGGLTYVKEDSHSKEPHWHASYPWVEDPSSLPNNKRTVEATFYKTEKQLAKAPAWKVAYTAQVHDMVDRGAAVKLSKDDIVNWDGPVWYVSHLVAPNPNSVTTPVRLVWNSSQRYRGVSLNDLLLKGPDVLNQIRAVLLRFRSGVYAALGDIRKMYNSVWLNILEMHLHRFLWRDSEEDELEEYAITRVNIGDKPAGCIAQLAMRETADLPPFAHLKEERQVIYQDSYVDDVLTSHNDLDQLKSITTNVERILKAGGFTLKPWVFSGQSGRQECENQVETAMVLPNQMSSTDNKALGLGYMAEEDKLHVMTAINFSTRKQKMRLGQNLLQEQVRVQTPNPLTRRELLSQVSGLYDPVGLVTPVKQGGAILVRQAFQEARGEGESPQTKDTWDMALSDCLREDAIKLFEEYAQLSKIQFARALTPPNFTGDPCAVTFSDGSEHAYGAVMYLRWDTDQGPIVKLVESKAKLTPLDHKGDAVKAEMCGAVFASRLRKYFELHSRIQVSRWYHIVDSQTVLGAIQRESYGYQTFFANRIGEIQGNTRTQEWWWIPGPQNIADVVTRGAGPEDLGEDSEWQNGPQFLSLPENEWPIKSAKELAATAKENVNKLQRKAFIAALTRAKAKTASREPDQVQDQVRVEQRRLPDRVVIQKLVDVKRFSVLTKLVKTVALVWRAAKGFMAQHQAASDSPKWEAIPSAGAVSMTEREDALRGKFKFKFCSQRRAVEPLPGNRKSSSLLSSIEMSEGWLSCYLLRSKQTAKGHSRVDYHQGYQFDFKGRSPQCFHGQIEWEVSSQTFNSSPLPTELPHSTEVPWHD